MVGDFIGATWEGAMNWAEAIWLFVVFIWLMFILRDHEKQLEQLRYQTRLLQAELDRMNANNGGRDD